MKKATEVSGNLLHEEDGQSLIEYSLIAGVVAIGCMTAMWLMKEQIIALFQRNRCGFARFNKSIDVVRLSGCVLACQQEVNTNRSRKLEESK